MDNIRLQKIGGRIKQERTQKGVTLDFLAEKIGVTRQTLSKWEKGESSGPTAWDILRMCDFFDCDYGYLIGDYSSRTRITTDLREETGLSELATENLRIAAGGPDEGPIDEGLAECLHDNLRSYEIGRLAKIKFVEALLENSDLWERIAVAAYDNQSQKRLSERDPLHTIQGIRHDQFASLAKEEAKEALSALFDKIKWDTLDDEYWTRE